MGSISKMINYSKEKRSWINSNGISDLPITLRGHRVVYDSEQNPLKELSDNEQLLKTPLNILFNIVSTNIWEVGLFATCAHVRTFKTKKRNIRDGQTTNMPGITTST